MKFRYKLRVTRDNVARHVSRVTCNEYYLLHVTLYKTITIAPSRKEDRMPLLPDGKQLVRHKH